MSDNLKFACANRKRCVMNVEIDGVIYNVDECFNEIKKSVEYCKNHYCEKCPKSDACFDIFERMFIEQEFRLLRQDVLNLIKGEINMFVCKINGKKLTFDECMHDIADAIYYCSQTDCTECLKRDICDLICANISIEDDFVKLAKKAHLLNKE